LAACYCLTTILKYLFIAALFTLLVLLLYSRLRPYLELWRKMSSLMKGTLDGTSGPAQRSRKINTENKLIRCAACGTWVPADRAIGAGAKLSEYCSRECIEKSADQRKRKLV